MESTVISKDSITENILLSFHEIRSTVSALDNETFHHEIIDGKWTIAQNVEHLSKVINEFSKALNASKVLLQEKFGFAERESRDYKSIFNAYYIATGKGVNAPRSVLPTSAIIGKEKQMKNLDESLKTMIDTIENWSEMELDKYIVRHPVLGMLTMREMLFFIIMHNYHHLRAIKKIIDFGVLIRI